MFSSSLATFNELRAVMERKESPPLVPHQNLRPAFSPGSLKLLWNLTSSVKKTSSTLQV